MRRTNRAAGGTWWSPIAIGMNSSLLRWSRLSQKQFQSRWRWGAWRRGRSRIVAGWFPSYILKILSIRWTKMRQKSWNRKRFEFYCRISPGKRRAAREKWLRSRIETRSSTALGLAMSWATERSSYLDIATKSHCWRWRWAGELMSRWRSQMKKHRTANLCGKLWARRLRSSINLCHRVAGISRWMCSCRPPALGREARKSTRKINFN